jgi:hypothetical protein
MKLGKYSVTTDSLNFILSEEYIGKDKDGNEKEMEGKRKYFGKIEFLINYLLNNEIKKALDKKEIKSLEDMQVLLEECVDDLAKQIKFNNPIAKKNFFDADGKT